MYTASIIFLPFHQGNPRHKSGHLPEAVSLRLQPGRPRAEDLHRRPQPVVLNRVQHVRQGDAEPGHRPQALPAEAPWPDATDYANQDDVAQVRK